MNTQQKSDEWQRHAADEAVAIEAQQADAGPTHSPIKGPPPFGDQETNQIVSGALGRQRELCAELLEGAIARATERQSTAIPLEELAQLAAAMRSLKDVP
jgi:hypothetical protein